jgi:glycosyltransferase involved in cell wall biosynthesis
MHRQTDMRPAIIIPVYNHGQRIAQVVHQALQLELPVFVIDDGCTDNTPDILAQIEEITAIRHPINRGKGAALLTGFAAAADRQCNWAISLDGDGQHRPTDAKALLAAAGRHSGRCIVIGKRQGMGDNEHVPWTSRFGRGFSNFWVKVSGGPAVSDSQSGFRLYPLPEILQLDVNARRYQFEVEVLVRAQQAGIATIEAPVGVVYQPKGERVSHFRPWLDFWRNSVTFSRLIFIRIAEIFRP